MEDFKELLSLAEPAGCFDFVKKMAERADCLKNQEFIKIAVTGMRTSGKTTFINDIIGSEVREPGNMDDGEKPLRVCFEQMEEEDGIQCVLVANREWHDLSTVIYELRQEDMIQGEFIADGVYTIDMVCFLVSATAPFNIDEVNYLKAMSVLNRQVIVNGIDYIKEEERQKVIAYITKINDSLGLPPVIIFQKGQDNGKIIRRIIPGYMELKASRNDRIHEIFLRITDRIEEAFKEKIKESEEASKESSERKIELSVEAKRRKADCYTIRMDIASYKKKAVERIMDDMNARLDRMVLNVSKETGKSASDEKIRKLAVKEYQNAAKTAVRKLREAYMADLEKVNSAAGILAIPGWTEAGMIELRDCAPEYDVGKFVYDTSSRNQEQGIPDQLNLISARSSVRSESTKMLIGTGLAVSGFVLAPLPAAVSWAGGIAAAGIGGTSYARKRQEEDEAALSRELKEIFKEGINSINKLIRENADVSYGKISKRIADLEKNFDSLNFDTVSEEKDTVILKKLLDKCVGLKNRHVKNT